MLKDQIQKVLKKDGFKLIYTPPYLPVVMPIELFWAGEKKRRRPVYNKRLMKECVAVIYDR